MTDTEPSDVEVLVAFSPEEYALISEHAAELNVSITTYVRQAATRQARDGQLKRQLLQEVAQKQGPAAEPFVISSLLVDDILDRDPTTLTQAEKEARTREAARECGIEYTPVVRDLGNALWAKIEALQSDTSTGPTKREHD
ncbi:hypothetical protein RKE30_21265 [Streptomyces sp. Li-HN-5-11]|uniref:plasmid mobilization protein n=1 Tax=Streptomyces sp. Li-HN-5-11 TaxID=3075432 RepID=UPI0028A9EE27|nr:hypothetical protein [Streptomyces sp. Li-HN-5-11]WNM32716.1 hypothetical protein RKE30_21050 [Streptomyces sp. Li-HN-5-11]WNM32754.1 hypothetical protein RKE30_21265 [Streptomyces sp. Li-HN-5-11]WOP38537.1 hypothetical protein RKE32_34525 [Streptomyces sp. Li-HN-5-13]